MTNFPSASTKAIRVALLLNLASLVSWVLLPRVAEAVPSFARQTGAACAQCHVQAFGPNLTTEGRQFKLNGYVLADQAVAFPPIGAMVQGSFTHTNRGRSGGAADGTFNENNNFAFDGASLFYAGRIFGKLGAFAELHYDGVADVLLLDNTDIRFANTTTIAGTDLVYGISANNNPTVQDLWNTLPAWGFPFASSPLAPTPAAAAILDDNVSQQVGGLTAYVMWNDLLYLEAGAYASFSRDVQRGLGTFARDENPIDGGAPYWRVALQRELGSDDTKHYFALGTFGFIADVFPERDKSAGANEFTDVGVDWTYQYFGDAKQHIVEFKGVYIHEDQDLQASQALGASANASNTLESFRMNGAYSFAQTYGVTVGYFRTWGTTDTLLYAPGAITGGASGSPDSEGFIAELDYIPFGKKYSFAAPWLNLRFALQYTAYTQFNGGGSNYDGAGRDASDNNTLFVNGWLAF